MLITRNLKNMTNDERKVIAIAEEHLGRKTVPTDQTGIVAEVAARFVAEDGYRTHGLKAEPGSFGAFIRACRDAGYTGHERALQPAWDEAFCELFRREIAKGGPVAFHGHY